MNALCEYTHFYKKQWNNDKISYFFKVLSPKILSLFSTKHCYLLSAQITRDGNNSL